MKATVNGKRMAQKAKKYAPLAISGLLAAFAVWGAVKLGQREIQWWRAHREEWRAIYHRWVEIGCPLPITMTEEFVPPTDAGDQVLRRFRLRFE